MSEEFKVTGSPEEIYLVYGDLDGNTKHEDCLEDCDGVSWCEDQQYDSDVRYVRADIAKEKLDAKDKELYLLRAFKTALFRFADTGISARALYNFYVDHDLIDESGNLTKLLTGE
jgi:hypothetical protein